VHTNVLAVLFRTRKNWLCAHTQPAQTPTQRVRKLGETLGHVLWFVTTSQLQCGKQHWAVEKAQSNTLVV
jgi:hypothetical protein